MKTKLAVLSIFLFSLTNSLHSQEKRLKYLSFESGMEFISCTPPEKDYIRGDVNPDPYYYEPSYIRALMYKNYVGVKAEVKLLNNKLGLNGGLRYTRMMSSIGKNDYWSRRSDFLYLLYKQQGTLTEYLKVKDINQITNYIGIPVELRIYPYRPRTFQIYYKVGADFNIRLGTKTSVDFHDPAMQHYEKDVSQIIESPWLFYSTFHLAIGLKVGKDDKPGFSIEACAPVAIIANFKSSFVTPEEGGGFQINIRFPL
jgi:hypothetical protein